MSNGEMKAPLFSICHTSARPDKWRAIYDDWMNKAVHPEQVEYVLCIDPRWGFSLDPSEYDTRLDNILLVQNTGRRCYVDGVNIAAKAATGRWLVVNADDQFACEKWDEQLAYEGRWLSGYNFSPAGVRVPVVIEVSTGTPDEHEKGIIGSCAILSRARYEAQGFVFYPEYESMFADNDFCATARKDGVIIDARHLMFPHRHAMFDGKGGWKRENWKETLDAAYLAQNRKEAYATGDAVYKRRKASGFSVQATRRSIALCLSGEQFQGVWVDALLALYGHLIDLNFAILKIRGATSNVYVTREGIRRALANSETKPDLCLWWDDDNPISIEHFDKLLVDLDSHPEVDGIAGWCWIHTENKTGFMTSCGEWAPDHLHWLPFPSRFAYEQEVRSFEVGGLPCLLMRYSALEKAGESCFLPMLDNRLEHGLTGEDISFFLNAEKGGCKFLVDPQVRVPHLKYVEVCPVFESEGAAGPVKVACMIRAKNEGRWIGRTVESVKALCGADIYVMEDGSIDNTREVAEAAGATVLTSPFVGRGLDECRDKQWLLEELKKRCSPDWIIGLDGDEEIEPGGCEKIRRVLESNPPVDCFAVRFLYLWDALDTIRIDRIYATLMRQSIFRANSGVEYRSVYEGNGRNHTGLHCSNAPGLGGMRQAPLNVFLLHYGYLFKEDRLKKYRYNLGLDPLNEEEDFYRHTIQGDLPEVSADATLKHAGPLRLATLPARLVPKFDVMPGPWVRPEVVPVPRQKSPELAAAD